ncbi:hypothetical protein P4132_04145 [Pseudomonas aeruginosa]|nr:hypothetical protein [Pseudomonas aeruginosa]
MSITLKGHALNQRQLDAITPVMNDLIQGRVDLASFDDACVKAWITPAARWAMTPACPVPAAPSRSGPPDG